MRSFLLIAAAASIFTVLPATDAEACGDKFLVVGRGVRYQDQLMLLQGNILIYANSNLPGSAVADLGLEDALSRAGHTYRVVLDMPELAGAVVTEQYDIVLSDVADAPLVQEALQRESVEAAVLPVVYKKDKEQLKQAKKNYPAVLKSPSRTRYLLAVINNVLVEQEATTSLAR